MFVGPPRRSNSGSNLFFLLDLPPVSKLDLPPLVYHELHLARDAQGRESWLLTDVTKIGDEVSKLTPCAYASPNQLFC